MFLSVFIVFVKEISLGQTKEVMCIRRMQKERMFLTRTVYLRIRVPEPSLNFPLKSKKLKAGNQDLISLTESNGALKICRTLSIINCNLTQKLKLNNKIMTV